jgi:menaquinone-dependent protoporphyrinogen IX oxidase
MLTDKEKQMIKNYEGNKNLREWAKFIKESKNPFFLMESAKAYNWDDGMEIPNSIANNIYCDKGIALNLFYLAEGIALFTGEVERNKYNKNWADFCEMIANKLMTEFYKEGPISFKPEMSRVTIYKYKKQGIPSALFEVVEGVKRTENDSSE